MALRANHAQKLQPVGNRHPHVEDDGVRPHVLGKLESGVGINRGRHLEALELEHARERIRHRSVVVYDEDGLGGGGGFWALGRRNHRIILMANEHRVKAGLRRAKIGYTMASQVLPFPVPP